MEIGSEWTHGDKVSDVSQDNKTFFGSVWRHETWSLRPALRRIKGNGRDGSPRGIYTGILTIVVVFFSLEVRIRRHDARNRNYESNNQRKEKNKSREHEQ